MKLAKLWRKAANQALNEVDEERAKLKSSAEVAEESGGEEGARGGGGGGGEGGGGGGGEAAKGGAREGAKEGAQAHRGAKPTVARGLKLAAWGARAKRRVRARKAAKFVAATIPFVRRDEGEEAEAAEKAEEARRDSASGMLEEMLARARAGGGASEPSSPEPDHPRIRPQQGEAATASESEGATPAKRWAAAGKAHGVTSSGGAGPVTERRGGSTTRRGGGTTRRGGGTTRRRVRSLSRGALSANEQQGEEERGGSPDAGGSPGSRPKRKSGTRGARGIRDAQGRLIKDVNGQIISREMLDANAKKEQLSWDEVIAAAKRKEEEEATAAAGGMMHVDEATAMASRAAVELSWVVGLDGINSIQRSYKSRYRGRWVIQGIV